MIAQAGRFVFEFPCVISAFSAPPRLPAFWPYLTAEAPAIVCSKSTPSLFLFGLILSAKVAVNQICQLGHVDRFGHIFVAAFGERLHVGV